MGVVVIDLDAREWPLEDWAAGPGFWTELRISQAPSVEEQEAKLSSAGLQDQDFEPQLSKRACFGALRPTQGDSWRCLEKGPPSQNCSPCLFAPKGRCLFSAEECRFCHMHSRPTRPGKRMRAKLELKKDRRDGQVMEAGREETIGEKAIEEEEEEGSTASEGQSRHATMPSVKAS